MVSRRKAIKYIGASLIAAAVLGSIKTTNDLSYTGDSIEGQTFDTGIILGGGLNRDGSLYYLSEMRANFARQLFSKRQIRKIIATGGFHQNWQTKSESSVAREYLLRYGISSNDILTEEESRSTAGNEYYAKVRVLETHGYKNNLVIASDFQAARARFLGTKILGTQYTTRYVGVETTTLERIRRATEEEAALSLYQMALSNVNNGDHEGSRKAIQSLPSPYNRF